MLKVCVLDKNFGNDFDNLQELFKKFIVDIYVRNKPEFIGIHGRKKNELINQAIMEFDAKNPLSILNENDMAVIKKRIDYQIDMAKKLIEHPSDGTIETKYYILKDEDKTVAFQQAQVMKAGAETIGMRYIAYTEHEYGILGKQKIIDSNNEVQYDICSEVLYHDVSQWFQKCGVQYEKTSTGKNMLPNILAYMMLKGFLPQSKNDRNIFFEKDVSNEIDKSILKKIYQLYVSNLYRTTIKDITTIAQEVEAIPELKGLTNEQKKGIVRCLLLDQERVSSRQNDKIKHLNKLIQKNIDNMNHSHTNYDLVYKIASKMVPKRCGVDNIGSEITTPFSSSQSKEVVLDFFKSLDENLLLQAQDAINNNIVADFQYKGTIEDIYELVHVASYSFCLTDGKKSCISNIFGQVAPECFEYMLSEYLSKKHIVSQQDILNMEKLRTYQNADKCLDTLIKLEFAKIKTQNGEIVATDLENIQEKYQMSNKQFSNILNHFSLTEENIDDGASYVMAQLILPYYIDSYTSNPSNALMCLNKYIEMIKHDNVKGGLQQLGINTSEALDVLIEKNSRKHDHIEVQYYD